MASILNWGSNTPTDQQCTSRQSNNSVRLVLLLLPVWCALKFLEEVMKLLCDNSNQSCSVNSTLLWFVCLSIMVHKEILITFFRFRTSGLRSETSNALKRFVSIYCIGIFFLPVKWKFPLYWPYVFSTIKVGGLLLRAKRFILFKRTRKKIVYCLDLYIEHHLPIWLTS